MMVIKRSHRGFTLIEVILAVVLLGMSLTVILGLQGAAVQQTVRDRERELALLHGRTILAYIESHESRIEPLREELPLVELLSKYGGNADSMQLSPDERTRLEGVTAKLEVTLINLPEPQNAVLKKVILDISWGASPLDSVSLTYFLPSVPKQEE
jgi:prepilin-type N-terminal cleavage/methylation domain-containing protein